MYYLILGAYAIAFFSEGVDKLSQVVACTWFDVDKKKVTIPKKTLSKKGILTANLKTLDVTVYEIEDSHGPYSMFDFSLFRILLLNL